MTDTTDIASLKKQIDTAADIICDLTDKLEAERQRADELVLHINTQANMREKAEKERDELAINWSASKKSIQFYKSEIAALRAKLANPVVLTSRYSRVNWADSFDASEIITAINAAGFTVKGE